ncbi:hypothetical protein JCM10450v2_007072 [Rhodotorula kratochvilovae]
MPAPTHTLPFVTVDAFTTRAFAGNPAAVLVFPRSDDALQQLAQDDALMQQIAAEFNLSETAFVRELDGGTEDEPKYELRWRTPVAEVPLCGHATLASAHTLFASHHPSASSIRFETRFSGTLFARRTPPSASADGDDVGLISLDFPAATLLYLSEGHRRLPKILAALHEATGLGAESVVRCAYFDKSDQTLIELLPTIDLPALAVSPAALCRASTRVVLTQPSPSLEAHDILSRVFASPVGIPEDPVTGAAHASLAPFWLASGADARARLKGVQQEGGRTLRARQVSRRGGEMLVVLSEDGKRVELRGSARRVMRGVLEL